jgi:DNA polymerase I-like protein with 3'-5' exonuclease and polymerase domains
VRDEIVLEVPEGMAREVAVILKETMIQAGKAYLSKVPVEVEVTIGETWAVKWTKQARTKIGLIIHIPDNVTDTSLFCLRVRANGAYAFKLALRLISRGLEGTYAHIVQLLHDEIILEARDAIADQVQAIVRESMEEALERIIPEVPFAVEIRVADSRKP